MWQTGTMKQTLPFSLRKIQTLQSPLLHNKSDEIPVEHWEEPINQFPYRKSNWFYNGSPDCRIFPVSQIQEQKWLPGPRFYFHICIVKILFLFPCKFVVVFFVFTRFPLIIPVTLDLNLSTQLRAAHKVTWQAEVRGRDRDGGGGCPGQDWLHNWAV